MGRRKKNKPKKQTNQPNIISPAILIEDSKNFSLEHVRFSGFGPLVKLDRSPNAELRHIYIDQKEIIGSQTLAEISDLLKTISNNNKLIEDNDAEKAKSVQQILDKFNSEKKKVQPRKVIFIEGFKSLRTIGEQIIASLATQTLTGQTKIDWIYINQTINNLLAKLTS